MQRKHCSSLIVGYSTLADLKSALYTDCTKYTRIFSSQPPLMYLFTKYSWLLLSLVSNSSQRHLWCIQCLVRWISSGLTSVLCVSFETSMDISASSEWGCASNGLRLRSASSYCFGVALVWPELHRACSKLPTEIHPWWDMCTFSLKRLWAWPTTRLWGCFVRLVPEHNLGCLEVFAVRFLAIICEHLSAFLDCLDVVFCWNKSNRW